MSLPIRAHLDGIVDPDMQKRLPPKEVVSDIIRLNQIVKAGGVPANVQIALQRPDGKITELKDPSEPVRYNTLFPRLFLWSYLVMPEDVPDKVDGENIVESAIFALKTFNKVVEEESDETLHIMTHLLEGQYGEKAKRAKAVMFLNARYKAGYLLMRPDINRPKEAAYYLKASMDAQRAEFPHKIDHWLMNPHVWASYGEALCLSEDFREAKVALERALTGCEVGSQPALAGCILRCHINLSLTLKALKVDATAQKEHTDWAATHLRKTPTRLITKVALNQILHPPGGRVHPVLEALGGESWLEKLDSRDVLSLKEEERSVKLCRQCGIRDIQKSLFRCSRCQYMYYCSKACQKANWKAHKEGCTDRYNAIKKLEKLKKEDPSAAQRHADWMEWRDAPTTHRKSAQISALGLHRDASRGRTHIVLQFVRYTPEVSKDPRFKFTIVATGVFRIKDALKMIEATMNLDPGEGTSFIQEVLNDTELAGRSSTDPVRIPILELTFGEDISPAWLSGNATNNVGLRAYPYNPDWRKTMNGTGVAPEPLILVKEMNAEDVEHVFD